MIVMYSKENCAPCRAMEKLFARKGIAYEKRDISVDAYREELYNKYRVTTVPVTVFGDDLRQVVVGYNVSAILKQLDRM